MLSLINYVHPSPSSLLRSISITLIALYNVDHAPIRPSEQSRAPLSTRKNHPAIVAPIPAAPSSPSTPMTRRPTSLTLPSGQPANLLRRPSAGRTRHFSSPSPFARRENAAYRTPLRLRYGGDVIVRDNDVKTSWRGRPSTHLEPTFCQISR